MLASTPPTAEIGVLGAVGRFARTADDLLEAGRALTAAERATKAVNLPAWRKLAVDWDHIFSGHLPGGSRVSIGKDLFHNMSETEVKAAVKNAYNTGKRMETQIDPSGTVRVRVRGYGGGYTIDMWVNLTDRVIDTAHPVP
jgi:hypothetical protein